MPDPSQLQFDAVAARQAQEDGEAMAAGAARAQPWKDRADLWLAGQPVGTLITADDLIHAIGLPDAGVNRNNAVGAWFSAQRVGGRLEQFGYRKSDRVDRHAGVQRVWAVTSHG